MRYLLGDVAILRERQTAEELRPPPPGSCLAHHLQSKIQAPITDQGLSAQAVNLTCRQRHRACTGTTTSITR
jgi:hypothetical protein